MSGFITFCPFSLRGRGGISFSLVKVWSLTNLADGAWHLQLVRHLSHAEQGRPSPPPAVTAVLPTEKGVLVGDEAGTVVSFVTGD